MTGTMPDTKWGTMMISMFIRIHAWSVMAVALMAIAVAASTLR